MRRVLALVLSLAAAGLLLAGCGDDDTAGPASTGPTSSAEVILDWYPNADHAGLIGAVSQGFFARHGLTVTTTVPTDPAAALKQVAAGKAPFALSYAPEVLIARNRGVPVVAVAAVVTAPLNSVIARADRGITRPRDLEGKTVGAAGVPSDRALLDTIVKADGGDPSKVRVRNVGYDLSPALAAGKVDAIIGAYWNIEGPELEAKGVRLNILRLEEHGVPAYDELVVVTSDEVIENDPRLVRDFLAGLAEGQAWARANPSAAVDALRKANPDLNAATLPEQVRLTVPLFASQGVRPIDILPAKWAKLGVWMLHEGLLEDSDENLRNSVNDGFVPDR